jgi:hypothetical protein
MGFGLWLFGLGEALLERLAHATILAFALYRNIIYRNIKKAHKRLQEDP